MMKRTLTGLSLACLLAAGSFLVTGCGGGGGGGGGQSLTSTPDLPLDQSLPLALAKVKSRKLVAGDNTPWVVMHAVIAFGREMTVTSASAGRDIDAVEFLCGEATYQGRRIFRNVNGEPVLPTRDISFGLTQSYVVQDHVDQYLYAFAGAGVPLEQRIIADDGTPFSVSDMLSGSIRQFRPTQELGWTLVALPIYHGITRSFTNDLGVTYSFDDLMALAVQRIVSQEAEAGTHHLYGVAFALQAHLDAGGTIDGNWLLARRYLDWHIARARETQKSDGSFDMAAFGGWAEGDSPSLRVWGTGHMLEWLYFALTPEQRRQDWISRAARRVVAELLEQDLSSFSDGGLYHAAHALRLYQDVW